MKPKQPSLSFEQFIRFVCQTAEGVFLSKEDGTTLYCPELFAAVLHLEAAKAYCGFSESGDFAKDYEAYKNLDLEALAETGDIDKRQYEAALEAIRERIGFEKELLLNKHISVVSPFDALAEPAAVFLNALGEKLADMEPSKEKEMIKHGS